MDQIDLILLDLRKLLPKQKTIRTKILLEKAIESLEQYNRLSDNLNENKS